MPDVREFQRQDQINLFRRASVDPHLWLVEVCSECGAQLNRYALERTGRCPVSSDHWPSGGTLVEVVQKEAE